ncbi:GGDEF domain-containing protein [Lacticaseibacillus parakribbianus]|uniref:GGDEF domain-containing protein n=1 Tax=Lacticaseibacillus parakribbianus TaxID=2970927 RepID=UPI0021CB2B4B|nr:GGDEF domain-containing protein [Lacticaseibacillus parakribbianus]
MQTIWGEAWSLGAAAGVTLFFATGFVASYTAYWQHLLAERQPLRRWGVAIAAIALAAALYLVNTVSVDRALMFHNMALFILVFITLDEGTSSGEFGLRAAALLAMLAYHHAGNLQGPAFWLAAGLIVLWLAVVRRLGHAIRYHVARHILAFSVVGLVYWPFLLLPLRRLTELGVGLGLYSLTVVATGVALRRNRLFRRISADNARQATYDALTNAKNYATFQRDLVTAFAHAQATGQPLAMMAIDLDHFKQLNDHYGHLAGNALLAGVADALRGVLGEFTLYRTGGEEFNVLLPGVLAPAAAALATTCWATVRGRTFQVATADVRLSLSIGVASLQAADQSVDALFAKADDSLYQSKHAGRDTVTVDGQTERRATRPAIETYTFYTQAVVDVTAEARRVASVIEVGRYAYDVERWLTLPEPVPLANQLAFAATCAIATPVVVTVSASNLAAPAVLAALEAHVAAHPKLPRPELRLTALPEPKAWAALQAAGFRVGAVCEPTAVPAALHLGLAALWVDDAGLAAAFGPSECHRLIATARAKGCELVATGIENAAAAEAFGTARGGRLASGYYFDRPALPRFS